MKLLESQGLSRSRPVMMVTLLPLRFTLECPILPCAPGLGTLPPQLSAPGVLTLMLLCQAPPLTSQAQEVSQAMSGFLSAASGPPSICCSGDCPYPALLCAPELAQVDGTTQEAALSRMPVGLSQWRPEGGRSEQQGHLSPHTSSRTPCSSGSGCIPELSGDAGALTPLPAPLACYREGGFSLW